MSRNLAVFDFDHTIIDGNSDIVVRDLISPSKISSEVKELCKKDNWTNYMQAVFKLLHENGVTEKDIRDRIEQLLPMKGMPDLIQHLFKLNYDIVVISDSNEVFIDMWLKKNDLYKYIYKIFTNPCTFVNGVLKIQMYHLQTECKLSTKNLCKGKILQEFLSQRNAENVNFENVMYVGDGFNDFCPILTLKENNLACVRQNYQCAKMISLSKEGNSVDDSDTIYVVKPKILFWNNGFDILNAIHEYSSE